MTEERLNTGFLVFAITSGVFVLLLCFFIGGSAATKTEISTACNDHGLFYIGQELYTCARELRDE